jgi:hypothetical protein
LFDDKSDQVKRIDPEQKMKRQEEEGDEKKETDPKPGR